MTATRIKLCGITRPSCAQAAVAHGADAIGLNFYRPSPRAIDVEQAIDIVQVVPPFVSVVALFVNADPQFVSEVLAAAPIDALQFHGDETADYCQQFQRPYVKALRVQPGSDIAAACAPYGSARGVLLDNYQPGTPGGTGATFDWGSVAQTLSRPMILAGGLNADNVGDAMAVLRPAAVDVSGGIESAPGIKDATKMAQFVAAVRAADAELAGGG